MILTLINNADRFLSIEGKLETLSTSQRVTEAIKKFFLFFFIALAAIFIPVAHFILVPLFLILSVFFSWKEFSIKQNLMIDNVYQCLNCKKDLVIPKKLNDNLRVNCKSCHQQYKLTI